MRTVALDPAVHDRRTFDCGREVLNNYLRHIANQQGKKDLSRTYVLPAKENVSEILGFYTLSMVSLRLEDLPPKWRKKYATAQSAGLIARLAVAKRAQGQGIGSILLVDGLLRLLNASDEVGFPMVFVDAKEGLDDFYRRFGFSSLPGHPERLFMTVKDIRASFSEGV